MIKIFCILLLFCSGLQGQVDTFSNPLLPAGADPWSIYQDGYYYYTHTVGNRLVIWKTKNLADLKVAPSKTIWTPPAGTMYSRQIWAPEIHFINKKWYVYFAADDGKNENHRMYVLENASKDPMEGEWIFKGKVSDPSDKWAIDGSVFEYKNQMYMIWSGWESDKNGEQDIYIAKLKNPWTIEGKRSRIGSPIYDWEQHGDLNDANNPRHVNVNEGPQMLQNKDKVFIIFSASGCWTEYYSLGMLELKGKNLLDSASWMKRKEPLFVASEKNGVFAPGHNSFFKSPNNKENWILYHANSAPGQGCGGFRSPRAQKFSFKEDGTPYFGEPVKTGLVMPAPGQ
ncbi:glycoside hydrolase family 43 protein [Flavitalea sp.]|nr:glycoside hydrolase family 43 protein [Flavitalea sp.]